jgi:type IV pilus assembly protein PilQ
LGFFFRNNSRSDNKTELLVFITPRIVEQRIVQR